VLTEMTEHIQALEYTDDVHVRVNANGSRNLIVNHYAAGIHVYE